MLAVDQCTGSLVASPVIAWLHRERRSTSISSISTSSSSSISVAPFKYLALELVRCPVHAHDTSRRPAPSAPLTLSSSISSRDQKAGASFEAEGCERWSRLLVSPEHVLYTQGRMATYAKHVRVGQVLPSLFDHHLPTRTNARVQSTSGLANDHSSVCQSRQQTKITRTQAAKSNSTEIVSETCRTILTESEQRQRDRWELRVRAIEHGVQSAEAYAPLTEAGTAFVDGALVSCYAHHLPVEVAHAAFAPLRALYRFRRALAEVVDTWLRHRRLHVQETMFNSTKTTKTTSTMDDQTLCCEQQFDILDEYSDRFHWYARVLVWIRAIWQSASVIWTLA